MSEHPEQEFQGTEAEVNRESARRTRRSFIVGGVSAAAGYGLWRAIQSGTEIGRQSPTMRRTFEPTRLSPAACSTSAALPPPTLSRKPPSSA